VSYKLQPGEGVADGIRRIVAEELDDAIAGLRAGADAPAAERDAAIHEARKSLKKARSALRLVRTDLKKGTRQAESTAMRDAGRRLSGARDAQVMLDTLAGLAQQVPSPPPAEVRALQGVLTARRDALAAELEGHTGLLGDVAAELETVRARVDGWRLRDQSPESVVAGAAIMHERGGLAMRSALRGGEDEDWHEWRKRVKDLWYSGRILEPIAGPQISGLVAEADELSDVLGDHNDLAVLLAAADGHPGLQEVIVARRDALRRVAAPLGRRLYAEKPKAFASRLEALLEAHEGGLAAAARWIAPGAAREIRAHLVAKPTADAAGRRHIAAELRRLGLRTSDFESVLPRRQGGFAAEDFDLLVERGIVRVGAPPDPALLAGL
jgi:CHAD domain-containing protein